MSDLFIIAAIFFGASFVQSASGFGAALVAMPTLTLMVGVETAAPTHSLLVLPVGAAILYHYWRNIVWRESLRMLITSLFFVPLGAYALVSLPSEPVTMFLGVLLLFYAPYEFYRSFKGAPSEVSSPPVWAPYVAGAFSGVLGGAYNTNGPPLILYAVTRHWNKETFKGTIQAVLFFQFIVINIVHTYNGLMTIDVFRCVGAGIFGVALGSAAGFAVDKRVNQVQFHRGVLILVTILGLSLIWRSIP